MEDTVYIVDDDAAVRDALGLLLSLNNFRTTFFADATSFLKSFDPSWRGCLLIDIRMPGMDGLTMQKHLLELGCDMPVIIITGHGDVESAREAFRSNAIDFIEKPFEEARLLGAVQEAMSRQQVIREASDRTRGFLQQFEELTPREKEVMELVVAGLHNRDIAEQLGISVRTVEVHKSRMMQKLRVTSITQLVRLNLQAR
jgi:RNA polymerase sigma factor (sigma-70 family)